ncbi:MAG: saccharopine dehydrogenase NADP-binding domain-containing protein [Chitinophagaceae bacterium]|nr:saccharopine dehydrogenase NADP-binding domain-containing protein [Chitinophagaceae bacterium]
MQHNRFLLYGANGYTGQLIARYAHEYGLEPVLAGRRKEPLELLSHQLRMPYKTVDLNDTQSLQTVLKEVQVVLHAAGPFQNTAKQMVDACLQTNTHYLDINGDIAVFEMLKQYDAAAKTAEIMVLPGAGFDVVPTDCIALSLKKLLPDAVSLKLAFAAIGGGLSHGTASTMVNKLGEGGNIRKNGKIIYAPLGQKGFWVDFGGKKLFVMNIPWGDVSTAYFTTGIPDIETYAGVSPWIYRILQLQPLFNWFLRTAAVRNIIKKKIDARLPGPTDEMRSKAKSFVWGQATNAQGKTASARLSGPDGYTLTTHSSLLITQKILQGNFLAGYQTPASAYGEDLVIQVPGVHREIIAELPNDLKTDKVL